MGSEAPNVYYQPNNYCIYYDSMTVTRRNGSAAVINERIRYVRLVRMQTNL